MGLSLRACHTIHRLLRDAGRRPHHLRRTARWRAFAIGAALITLVVGASCLYLGVHWFTDVLGGYALGLAWLAVVMVMTLILEDRPRRSPH